MMKTIFNNSQKRGSALLIVLGFLSFLIISSVSFAIYMRLERQASSNYRHATTARHMLNSALYRAMDEIDSELRISKLNGVAQPLKFPDWPGRTRPSAVPNGQDNGEEARVLSMEALSYIPAILVNDVRRYAVTNADDVVTQNKYSYLGAKWRPLSMPVTSLAGGEDAWEESVIGRYAYLCVNLSDMLDVNVCRAAVRDASTNRVSIGHLFATDAARTSFDTNFRTKDFCYQTLQDFYACMYARGDTTFGSPLHNWMTGSGISAFNTAGNHILVAGGMAKPEPTKSTVTAINIADKIYQGQANVNAAADAFAGQLSNISDFSGCSDQLKCMLMDYLDEDNAPYWLSGCGMNGLYRPTAEMVPMIYRIYLPSYASFVSPTIEPGTSVASGSDTLQTYNLRLTKVTSVPIQIETLFPFKYWDEKKTKKPQDFNFKLETRAYLVAVKFSATATDLELSTQNPFLLKAIAQQSFHFELTAPASANPLPSSEAEVGQVCQQVFTIPPCTIPIYTKKLSSGEITSWESGFVEGDKIRIALVVFACVKNSNGDYVDMAPGYFNPDAMPSTDFKMAISDAPRGIVDRLYFQTSGTISLNGSMALDLGPYPMDWGSLIAPDPRYNHKASNWVPGTDVADSTEVSDVTKGLLGQDGRDGDVYMFVSNLGQLYSPGEFGFLSRPRAGVVTRAIDGPNLKNVTVATTTDYAAMFRTVRLYDYTSSHLRDNIYDYFKAENADGTAIGARVNPLSDLSQVLAAAIERTPVDYWYAALDPVSDAALIKKYNFSSGLISGGTTASDWIKVTNAWGQCVINAKKITSINTAWNVGLSDIYGSYDAFGWYSASPTQTSIFNPQTPPGTANGIPANLSAPLSEIDRKMLYSFSLDSFSDRQQLFLYILRAEATVPSLGGKTKSLAGGHAVALVWRDPYPVGYSYNKTTSVETWQNKGSKTWYQQNLDQTLNRISPWYQVNNKQYNEEHEAYDTDSSATRLDGYHEQKILFFKRLEN